MLEKLIQIHTLNDCINWPHGSLIGVGAPIATHYGGRKTLRELLQCCTASTHVKILLSANVVVLLVGL